MNPTPYESPIQSSSRGLWEKNEYLRLDSIRSEAPVGGEEAAAAPPARSADREGLEREMSTDRELKKERSL